MREFETRLMVPICKHDDIEAYYQANSSYPWIGKINVPFLSISSLDDPIISSEITLKGHEKNKQNPNITSILTKHGSHLGWLESIAFSNKGVYGP